MKLYHLQQSKVELSFGDAQLQLIDSILFKLGLSVAGQRADTCNEERTCVLNAFPRAPPNCARAREKHSPSGVVLSMPLPSLRQDKRPTRPSIKKGALLLPSQ